MLSVLKSVNVFFHKNFENCDTFQNGCQKWLPLLKNTQMKVDQTSLCQTVTQC